MKEITEDICKAWGTLSRAELVLSREMPEEAEQLAEHIIDEIIVVRSKFMQELECKDKEEFLEAIKVYEARIVQASLDNSTLEPRSCPANNPACDAQLYSSGDFVFCPKCGQPNPNFSRTTVAEKRVSSGNIGKQQPVVDIKAGKIQWK